MAWDGFNQRKFPRIQCRCEIHLETGTSSKPIHTTTENLGVGGLCAFLEEELERYTKCRVKVELDSKLPELECDARVVWKVATKIGQKHGKRFDTGLEFLNLDTDKQALLRDFIQSRK